MYFCAVDPDLLCKPVERWVEWYFNRPASPDEPRSDLFEKEVVNLYKFELLDGEDRHAEIILEKVVELTQRYAEWTPHYTAAQLSQGMWAMFSVPCSFEDLLLADELSFDLRARAMRSLIVPYRDFVRGWNPREEMPHAWDMLWDGIFGYKKPGPDIADVGLECLTEILAMEDTRCQAYALHGLNHLNHPDRPAVIKAWIDAHRYEDWNWTWVKACRDGEAM